MNTATETQATHCDRCDRDFPYYHVSVQRDGTPLCFHCVNEINEQIRKANAEARKAAPRCECDGCKRRGTWRVSGVLICGTHKNRVQKARERQLAAHGSFALIAGLTAAPLSRERILELAK